MEYMNIFKSLDKSAFLVVFTFFHIFILRKMKANPSRYVFGHKNGYAHWLGLGFCIFATELVKKKQLNKRVITIHIECECEKCTPNFKKMT